MSVNRGNWTSGRRSGVLGGQAGVAALSLVAGLSVAACLARADTSSEESEAPGVAREALGEPQAGFPSWSERVVRVWANRARADPATELASCSGCAEKSCYSAVPPLVWRHGLARAARFHSDNLVLGSCGL